MDLLGDYVVVAGEGGGHAGLERRFDEGLLGLQRLSGDEEYSYGDVGYWMMVEG